MPHLTLEYTDNIDFEIQPLLARLHAVGPYLAGLGRTGDVLFDRLGLHQVGTAGRRTFAAFLETTGRGTA